MDDFIWLDQPVNKNKVKKLEIENLETLQLSFDGSIMAVKKNLVEDYYHKNEVALIKAGYKKMPKSFPVSTEDELYEFLSYFISI